MSAPRRPVRRGPRARKLEVDRAGLKKLSARASGLLLPRWDEYPKCPPGWTDPDFDAERIKRLVELARAHPNERSPRVALRVVAIKHLERTPPAPLPLPLARHLVHMLRSPDPRVGLGMHRVRGRDSMTETILREARAWVIYFLASERGSVTKAYMQAAPILGYRSTKALRQACSTAVLEKLKAKVAAAGRGADLRVLLAVMKACRFLSRQS